MLNLTLTSLIILSVHLFWTHANTSFFLYWGKQDCTQCSQVGSHRGQIEYSLSLTCWLHFCNSLPCSCPLLPQEYTADEHKSEILTPKHMSSHTGSYVKALKNRDFFAFNHKHGGVFGPSPLSTLRM